MEIYAWKITKYGTRASGFPISGDDAQTQTENASKDVTEPEKVYVDEEGIIHEVYTQEPQTRTRTGEEDAPMCTLHNKIMKKDLEKMVTTGMTIAGRRAESGSNAQAGRRPINKRSIFLTIRIIRNLIPLPLDGEAVQG